MDKAKKVPEGPTKSKEEVLAERKAKKAEKAAKKSQPITHTNKPTAPSAPDARKTPAQATGKLSGPAASKPAAPSVAAASNPPASSAPIVAIMATIKKNVIVDKEVAPVVKPEEGGKSKAELKAERRLKQEAERAAKVAALNDAKQPAVKAQTKRIPDQIQADRPSVEKRLEKKFASQKVPRLPPAERKVQLFSHLHQQERSISLLTKELPINHENIHPAIIKLGLQYASGIISGSNARAVALMDAFKRVIDDYTTPEHKELSRDLDVSLKPCINFLKQCRPISVSMGNAIRYLKRHITNIHPDKSDAEAKRDLHEHIDKYIDENVKLAGDAICEEAGKKIASGDVILTYGYSSLLLRILLKAFDKERKIFKVVVLDGTPRSEGLQLLRRLVAAQIPCVYMLISGASYIMPEVTKVLLGAHALLANGNVMSRVGSSQVALVAKAHNVPVLVCCETHKFCERVQTDSFVFNELGDPDDLIYAAKKKSSAQPVENWRDLDKLSLLNLTYDVTPGDLVTAVITELAVLPCTSVPVVLRLKHAETAV